MIFVTNELRQDPEERLDEYVQRCVATHYEERGEEQRLRDLGITEDMAVVRL
ncbi:MAG: hypothetical protein HC812_19125 [Leptolyngbya sp. RL_3_1]|nr:hypothetical protein [Leptolyngbya sp. RL_3_1]